MFLLLFDVFAHMIIRHCLHSFVKISSSLFQNERGVNLSPASKQTCVLYITTSHVTIFIMYSKLNVEPGIISSSSLSPSSLSPIVSIIIMTSSRSV